MNNTFFENGQYYPRGELKKLLRGFLPDYIREVRKLYNDRNKPGTPQIKEIRIEGHTSSKGKYISNVKLSNDRAYKVAEYIFDTPYFGKLSTDFQEFIKNNTVTCGYSSTRLLDKNGKPTTNLRKEDESLSRRVEFRIILESKANHTNEN